MNNTIAWIMTIFIIVTIIVDLNARIGLWLLANVIASGTVIAFAVLFANASSIKL